MLIRKPFAFLIKYFKLIHIILFVLMTFMMFKLRSIYVFFRNYLKNGTFLNIANLSDYYVGNLIIITSIALIGFSLLIFLLMKNKKKPIKLYISSVIFYFITFISLLLYSSIFITLEYNNLSNQILVLLRDLAMIIYYVNFIFLIAAFIRGFGFNIKKFNFEKDLKELDITDADREEIELNSTIDYENILNFARKRKRNFKYYIKENSYILIVLSVIIVLSLTSYFVLDNLVFNKIYKENETFVIRNLDMKINSSYYTNLDKNGEVISSKKKYIIVNFNALNNTQNSIKLNIENTRLNIDGKYYYPQSKSEFKDLGTIYKNQTIYKNTDNNFIIIFELLNEEFNKKAILEFYYGKKDLNEEVKYFYENIKLDLKEFNSNSIGEYNLNEQIDLNNTYFKDNKLNVSSFEILEMENYKYNKCNNKDGNCSDYQASVVPNSGKVLLKLEYSLKNKIDIFKYLKLEYKVLDKTYTLNNDNIIDVTPSNYQENTILLEVSNKIKETNNLNLLFDIRGVTFKVLLRSNLDE